MVRAAPARLKGDGRKDGQHLESRLGEGRQQVPFARVVVALEAVLAVPGVKGGGVGWDRAGCRWGGGGSGGGAVMGWLPSVGVVCGGVVVCA